ncbi:MAG: TRAP transporter large permease [Synergistaceae bacterium]|jgi:C4-dicarboxylate transporter DctM subunit|nr:TRAP transporter large permease [Synergistaceae bacterium]
MTFILFCSFFFALIIGVPIAVCLGFSAVFTLILSGSTPLIIGTQTMFKGVDSFPLMAIPFFILAGNIMSVGGISKRLVAFAMAFMGKVTGGLAMVSIFASMIFAAISGSSPATTAAIGSVMLPSMVRQGYKGSFAAATVAAAGTVGQVIPPSVPMVIYGVLANVSISQLFVAGLFPGILMGVAMMFIAYLYAKRNGLKQAEQSQEAADEHPKKAVFSSLWAIMMPCIILGGIYSGIFTPTEAAAVAVFYGLFVGLCIYREMRLSDLPKILFDSACATAVIMFIMATANYFGWILTSQRIPQAIAQFFLNVTNNKYVLLLLFNIILLIAGCFLNPSAAIVLLTPILLPVLTNVGVPPILTGIIMVVNLAIGQTTPPVGACLYVACNISGIKLEPIIKESVPYLLALILALFLITYVEAIALFPLYFFN